MKMKQTLKKKITKAKKKSHICSNLQGIVLDWHTCMERIEFLRQHFHLQSKLKHPGSTFCTRVPPSL